MNLWIILAFTWISITVVIADHGWFVQDSPPAGEESELFSREHLLVVKPKQKPKPKSAPSVNANKDHHANENPKKKVVENKQQNHTKLGKKSDVNDVVSEHFIPVQRTGRKPLAISEKHVETMKTPVKVNNPEKKSPAPSIGSSKTTNHAWFIQDDSLNGEDDEDLFSSENLLVVKPKSKYKPKLAKPTKPVNSAKTEKSSQTNGKPKTKKVETKQKTPSKSIKTSDVNDVESEHLIPVHGTGRKPLAVVQNPVDKVTPLKKPAAPLNQVIEYDEVPCDSEKDIDCLMETEELILVAKKKPTKPAHKVDMKPLIKRENVEALKQEVVKKTEPIKKKVEEIQRADLHRRLLDNDKSTTTQPSKPIQQPLIYEVKDEDDEGVEEGDLLETEKEDEAILKRLRRQATGDDMGSGDEQTASFEEETPPTSQPVYTLQFSNTLNATETNLTDALRQQYAEEFASYLRDHIGNYTGFVGIGVRSVSLDENGRVVVDWELILSQSGAPGATPEQRTQNLLGFLNDTLVPGVNNLSVMNDRVVVYNPLDRDVIYAIAESRFGDVCQSDNACLNGYVCIHQNTLAVCQHKCYYTGLINQCQNNGSCQLDQAYEAYCQCGDGYTGDLCQNVTTGSGSTYSTTQVVGAGVGGAVAAAGLIAGALYLIFFWRRRERDMEYSYFGDDDQAPTAFNEADANLGSNSYVIERPHLSFEPINI